MLKEYGLPFDITSDDISVGVAYGSQLLCGVLLNP